MPALPGRLTYGACVDRPLAIPVEAIRGYMAVVVASGHPVLVERQATPAAVVTAPCIPGPASASDSVG
jgi:hypothetical protein